MFHSIMVQYTKIAHLFTCNTDLHNSELRQAYKRHSILLPLIKDFYQH